MTTTLDFTPARVDLNLWAGDDDAARLYFYDDAPDDGVAAGSWNPLLTYPIRSEGPNLVEHDLALYVCLAASLNVEPGTDPTKWRALTPTDLTGYTDWAAQIRSTNTDADDFTVDDGLQANSIIDLALAGTVKTARLSKGPQRWDLQVVDPSSRKLTPFAGRVFISEDATRP